MVVGSDRVEKLEVGTKNRYLLQKVNKIKLKD